MGILNSSGCNMNPKEIKLKGKSIENNKSVDILLISIFSLVILITRIPFMSKFLYEWDSGKT